MGRQAEQLREWDRHPGLAVSVRTGVEQWQHGEVTLNVRGDGHAEVLKRASGEQHRFTRELAPDELRELGASLADVDELEHHGGATPPDAMPVVVRVESSGDVLRERTLWTSERFNDPDLGRVLDAYDALVADLSDSPEAAA